ncbi:MAG: NUDIX hydrolase [Candidatus Heimdallarchaeota archaeon]|nr:MAG: NUDIX hydrolase [Candidatus Heimdallarchaeota archaeon]
MGKNRSALWEGRIPLSSVFWRFNASKPFQLSPSFEERRLYVWKSMQMQYPHLYDGELLVLSHFYFENSKLILITRSIRFSQVLVHLKDGLKVSEHGSLGFQAIITNPPSHSLLLVGERSHESEYKPGFLTIPGGIFESDDARNSLTNACVRELDEEINVPLNINSFYLIAMLPEANQLGTCLLIEVETTEEHARTVMPNLKVTGNEEWEENQLEWLSFSQICDLKKNRLMEGLSFLRAKFCQ